MEKEEYQLSIDDAIDGVQQKTSIVVDRDDPLVEATCLIIEQIAIVEQKRFSSIKPKTKSVIGQIGKKVLATPEKIQSISNKIAKNQRQQYQNLIRETLSRIIEELSGKLTPLLWLSIGFSTLSITGIILIFVFMPKH